MACFLLRPPANSVPLDGRYDIRTFVVSLIGAAAVTAGLVFIRQQKQVETLRAREVPAGETVPRTISLERLRELGY